MIGQPGRDGGGPRRRAVGVGQAIGHRPVLVAGEEDIVQRQPEAGRKGPCARDPDDPGPAADGFANPSPARGTSGASGPTASVTLSSLSAPLADTELGQIVDVDAPDPVVPPPADGEDGRRRSSQAMLLSSTPSPPNRMAGRRIAYGDLGLGQRPLHQRLPPEVGQR